MPHARLESGKRWAKKTLEEFEQGASLEWGSPWVDVPKRHGRSRAESVQLILSIGRERKVVWLPTADLCDAGTGQETARIRVRDALGRALSQLVQKVG